MVEGKKGQRLEYSDLIVEKKYPVGYITINRPEKRNALTNFKGGSCDQLEQAFTDMRDDPEIRVFILKGVGDCFCAGFDMSGYGQVTGVEAQHPFLKGRTNEPFYQYVGQHDNPEATFRGYRWFNEVWENPTPSIALIDSFCLGAGLWLCNLCDMAYATPDSVFGYPPIKYGAPITTSILPPWVIPLKKINEMALAGKMASAQEAYDWGIITAIVPRAEIEQVVNDVAMATAKVPPLTNYYSKMLIHQYYETLGMGVKQTYLSAAAVVAMMERTSLPGHYEDFLGKVRDIGFTAAYKEHRAIWSYPDPVMDKEVARLKAIKGKK